MNRPTLDVTLAFLEMIDAGQISRREHMEDLTLPGAYEFVPSKVAYGVPDQPIRREVHYAQLGQHSSGNIDRAE